MTKPTQKSNEEAKKAYYNFTNAIKKELGVKSKPAEKPLKINMSFDKALKKIARHKTK